MATDVTSAAGSHRGPGGHYRPAADPEAEVTSEQMPVDAWGYIAYRMDKMDRRMSGIERDVAVIRATTITRKSVLVSLVALAPLMAGAVTLAFMIGNQLWGD